MYYWLTVFSPRAVNFSLGSLSTNWKYPHSQSASWNDFRGPSVQVLPHPLRVSLARVRSLFRLLRTATFISYYLQTCLASFCTSAFSIMNLAYNAFTYTTSVLWILVSEVFREIFLPVRREARGTRINFHDSRGEEDHLLFLTRLFEFFSRKTSRTGVVLPVSTFYTVGSFPL